MKLVHLRKINEQTTIEQLRQLDPQGTNGTIQAILMSREVNLIQFDKALLFALNAEIGHKNLLQRQNKELIKLCKNAKILLEDSLFQ